MPRRSAALLVVLTLMTARASAQPNSCNARPADEPQTVAKAWWRAFALADTPYLEAASAETLSFTANTGRTFRWADVLAEAAARKAGAKIEFEWKEEHIRQAAPSVAVFTSRVAEIVGARPAFYRYLAVLECADGKWQVSAAQSTRDLLPTPRLTAADKSLLENFAGRYSTAAGKVLRVLVRDAALVLVDPAGAETILEPIGPALFEARGVSYQGLIRFIFTRDSTGKVTALTRITTDVTTFPRIE